MQIMINSVIELYSLPETSSIPFSRDSGGTWLQRNFQIFLVDFCLAPVIGVEDQAPLHSPPRCAWERSPIRALSLATTSSYADYKVSRYRRWLTPRSLKRIPIATFHPDGNKPNVVLHTVHQMKTPSHLDSSLELIACSLKHCNNPKNQCEEEAETFSKMKLSQADGETKELEFVDEPCDLVLSSPVRHGQSPPNIPRKVQFITDLISSEMMGLLQYHHKGHYRRIAAFGSIRRSETYFCVGMTLAHWAIVLYRFQKSQRVSCLMTRISISGIPNQCLRIKWQQRPLSEASSHEALVDNRSSTCTIYQGR
ncbi:uncharacterized protein CLUP02_06357 [Colletotrichum lupini]|uniref:Uncharacterized protein n=1 Tax=Colletotrichum lupini TaxID=145971 RepID=A0A9Q8WFG9_9PEZI|nr:uncharacterized protein CLUP02_06357 [Colletotrichum lupini]UQC80872.1 hypothetical protein CLUP02_06357 [Colletotrichum lupini]